MSKRAMRREVRRLERFERLHGRELEAANRRADYLAREVRRLRFERDALSNKLRQLVLAPDGTPFIPCVVAEEESRLVLPVKILAPYDLRAK